MAVLSAVFLGASCSSGAEPSSVTESASVDSAAFVGVWVPVEERWSEAGVFVELDESGEFRGHDACKILGGRWETTASGEVIVELGPTSGLYCEVRFPLVDLLGQPLQLEAGERLVLDAAGPEPTELVQATKGANPTDDHARDASVDPDAATRTCVGTGFAPVGEYDGVEEAAAVADIVANDEEVRVIGRDGECNVRTDDARDDRVNLYLQDGDVVWAGRG